MATNEEIDAQAVGRRIRILREALGNISSTAFGSLCGVTQSAVSNWEVGIRLPEHAQVAAMHREWGVTWEYLFLGEYSHLPLALHIAIREAEASPF